MKRLASPLLALILLAPAQARLRAQPLVVPPGSASTPNLVDDPACAGDAARLCAKSKTPQDALDCLRSHAKELSHGCLVDHPGWLHPPAAAARGSRRRGGGQGSECGRDAQRLCTAAENQPGMRAACLRKHFAQLSPGCRQTHPEWKPVAHAPPVPWSRLKPQWRAACSARPAPCAGALGSEAALRACLDKRWAALSPACRGFAAAHDSWPRLCPDDYPLLCPNVPPPQSSACMLAHASELSEGCRAFARAYLGKRKKSAKPPRAKRASR